LLRLVLSTVEASVKNTSDAMLEVQALGKTKVADPLDVSKVLKNSLSPIEATDFVASGLASVFPAGTPSAKIASFAKQSTAKFNLQDLVIKNLQQLSLQRVGVDK
jgi:hypothetical protein